VPMQNPPHPGRIILQECLEPLGISITQAAQKLGVSRIPSRNSLVAAAVFPRRWPFGSRKHPAASRRSGRGYRCSMTWHKR
jgi:hypothetical protein